VKRLAVVLGVLSTIATLLATGVFSAEEETVNATVTPVVITILVSPTSVDYGALQPLTTGNIPSPSSVSVQNKGSVLENIQIKGAHSTDWTLAATPGENQFTHYFSTNNSTFTKMTTGFQSLASNVAVDGIISLFLRLDMPTSTTSTAQQTLPVHLLATQAN
jgi:hypothetical protein